MSIKLFGGVCCFWGPLLLLLCIWFLLGVFFGLVVLDLRGCAKKCLTHFKANIARG